MYGINHICTPQVLHNNNMCVIEFMIWFIYVKMYIYTISHVVAWGHTVFHTHFLVRQMTKQKFEFTSIDLFLAKCPPGSGACRIDPSGTAFGMGDPVEKLQSATGENKFMLHYTTDTDVNGCTAKPSTSIEFRCPSVGGVRKWQMHLCAGV